jgi:hypothetical protein
MPRSLPSILGSACVGSIIFAAGFATAYEAPAAARKESAESAVSQKRLQFFKDAVRELKVTLPGSSTTRAPEFVDAPILRYNDATREFFDAGVWKLGAKGRPWALLTLEMYRRADGTTFLMHEFTSLTEFALAIDTDLGVHWAPRPAELKFAAVPDAPEPAETDSKRLIQMRTLARRFSAAEEYLGVKTTLRLLTQPIDRYSDPINGIDDAGMFAFAIGTNPEAVMLLEARKGQWMYALARTSSAETLITLDDTLVKTFPTFVSEGRGGSYYAEGYPVEESWAEK